MYLCYAPRSVMSYPLVVVKLSIVFFTHCQLRLRMDFVISGLLTCGDYSRCSVYPSRYGISYNIILMHVNTDSLFLVLHQCPYFLFCATRNSWLLWIEYRLYQKLIVLLTLIGFWLYASHQKFVGSFSALDTVILIDVRVEGSAIGVGKVNACYFKLYRLICCVFLKWIQNHILVC